MSRKLMNQVYIELHKDAFQWARQCTNYSDELAADILQTVYLKILNGKAKFNGKSSLKTWLFSVIKFTVMDFYRGQKRQESLQSVMEVPDNAIGESLDSSFYIQMLKKLSENQSQVLLLVFYHNYTLEAVAEVMGLSIGTIRTHYDRGKKKLKKILENENSVSYDERK